MHLLDLIWPARIESRLADISSQIAERIKHAVWERVCRRLPTMGVAESRGYIRTRAVAIIHREVAAALFDDGAVSERHRRRLIELTQDEIMYLISARAAVPAPAFIPATRRAA